MADKEDEKPRTITLEEVKNHKGASSCWIIIHNKVYDVTKFLDEVRSQVMELWSRNCLLISGYLVIDAQEISWRRHLVPLENMI